jgi:class 3 adenylate cyclase
VETDARYFKYGDIHIAYTVGEDNGPRVLIVPTWLMNFDSLAQLSPMAEWTRRVGSFSHFATFDFPGSGASDPISLADGQAPGLDIWVDIVVATLDELGWPDATLCAWTNAGPVALACAAWHAERVSGLMLCNSMAAVAPDLNEEAKSQILEAYAQIANTDAWTTWMMPSIAGDTELLRQFARFRRQSMAPAVARANLRMSLDIDVRGLLADVRCPVLVLDTVASRAMGLGHGRYLADHLPDVSYVEMSGVDMLPIQPQDTEAWVAEIQRFLRGHATPVQLNRVFATVLFTDFVSSTARAAEAGDHRWRDLLDRHDEIVRATLHRYGGRLIKSTGDGILATLDAPARAVRCAQAIRDATADLGIQIRSGLHAGEIESRGEDIGGTAVNIARRVCDSADGDEVRVSETVTQIVAGSGLRFDDLGPHELKGVPGTWRLFRARD